MQKRNLALVAAALVLYSASIWGKSYSDLYALVQGIMAMNSVPGVHAAPKFVVRNDQGTSLHPLEIVIHATAGAISIPIDRDGLLSQPLTIDLLHENPEVELLAGSERVRGRVEVSIEFSVEAPVTQHLSPAAYRDMLSRYAQARDTQGFLTRMSMHSPKGVLLHFEQPCTASAYLNQNDAATLLACDENGDIRIGADAMLATEDGVAISQAPTRIELDF